MGNLIEMGNTKNKHLSESLFYQAVDCEQSAAPEKAKNLYQRAIILDPLNRGALINLGTIFFKEKDFAKAEQLYRQAIAVSQDYDLAHFNLANLLDMNPKTNREAIMHYRISLKINPKYADAYYNLALALEKQGSLIEAAGCWYAYLKLERSGIWVTNARRALNRIKKQIVVSKPIFWSNFL